MLLDDVDGRGIEGRRSPHTGERPQSFTAFRSRFRPQSEVDSYM